MNLLRCDECCNVLDWIDDGVVYECSEEVYQKTSIEVKEYEDEVILTKIGSKE